MKRIIVIIIVFYLAAQWWSWFRANYTPIAKIAHYEVLL